MKNIIWILAKWKLNQYGICKVNYKSISCIEVASKLGLKKGNNGNYHCFNPSKHKNGDNNPSLNINFKGYNCFGCSVRGNNVELVNRY